MHLGENDGIVVTTNENTAPEPEVKQPVEQTPDEPVADAPPESVQDDSNKEKPERPGPRERAKLREARLENEQLKQQLAALQQKPGTAKDDSEPKFEDFEDAIEWSKAQAKWEAKQAVKSFQAEQLAGQSRQAYQKVEEAFSQREETYAETIPDYHEKVDALYDSGLVTPMVEVAVKASDMGPELAYYFANYTDGQSDLAQLRNIQDPRQLTAAIKQVEAYVKQHSNPPAAVKTTQAAAPINPPRSNVGGSTKDVTKMSFRDFVNKAAPIR